MTTTDLRDQIARILCDLDNDDPDDMHLYREHADAVLAVIAPLIAREKAAVLRRAASALPEPVGLHCEASCHEADRFALRERADQIEKEADRGH